jgi:heptosyltransferase-2
LKCLVIQTAFLGDVVLTLPLLGLLRGLPELDVLTVLTTPVGAEFLRDQNVVDSILVYDKRGADRGAAGFRRAVGDTRQRGFDLAVIPHRSFRSALLALLSNVPARIGFDESGGRLLLTERVVYRSRPHEIERMAELARAAGVTVPAPPLDFHVRVPDRGVTELARVLDGRAVSEDERLVVVAPGSRWRTKRWDAERFGAAAALLADETGLRPVFTGTRFEAEACASACAASGRRGVDLTGALSMPAWVALLARADVALSNDSAATHVAAGVGTPVVTVFGPTVTAQGFAPYSSLATVVEAPVDCRPCGRHGSDDCRVGSHACMSEVSVDDVVSAARAALAWRSAA